MNADTTLTEPTPDDIAAMHLVLAVKRDQVHREATPTELLRWARTYEGVARAMRARSVELQAEAARYQKPLAGINRPAPPKAAPAPKAKPAAKPFKPTAAIPTKAPMKTPEQVLANRPAKPPGKGTPR